MMTRGRKMVRERRQRLQRRRKLMRKYNITRNNVVRDFGRRQKMVVMDVRYHFATQRGSSQSRLGANPHDFFCICIFGFSSLSAPYIGVQSVSPSIDPAFIVSPVSCLRFESSGPGNIWCKLLPDDEEIGEEACDMFMLICKENWETHEPALDVESVGEGSADDPREEVCD